jgi:hypothetical protein
VHASGVYLVISLKCFSEIICDGHIFGSLEIGDPLGDVATSVYVLNSGHSALVVGYNYKSSEEASESADTLQSRAVIHDVVSGLADVQVITILANASDCARNEFAVGEKERKILDRRYGFVVIRSNF